MNERWQRLGAAGVLVCGLFGCKLDDRQVTVRSLRPDGGAIDNPPSGGSGGGGTLEDPPPPASGRLELSTTAVDLGPVSVGFPARTRVRISNAGEEALSAPELRWLDGSSADVGLVHNPCLNPLAPGESCAVRVQFVPSQVGQVSAALRVASAEGGSAEVQFTGSGVDAGDWLLAPAAGSFRSFGGTLLEQTREATFTVRNPSTEVLGPLSFSLNRPEFTLVAPAEGGCVSGTTLLAQGESCDVRVAFRPVERGPVEATLTGMSASSGSVSLTLSGVGLLPATLGLSAERVSFDGVVPGQAAQRSLLVENLGDEALTLLRAELQADDSEVFSILDSNCGANVELAPGGRCDMLFEFRPTEVGAESSAELVVQAVGSEQELRVPLEGLALEPGSLTVEAVDAEDGNFGEVPLRELQTRTFRVSNPTAQPSGLLTLRTSEGFSLPLLEAEDACIDGETSLVDGQACSVAVAFEPTRRQPFIGSLTVSSQLAGSTGLALSGRGIVGGRLELQEELDFGRVTTAESAVRSVRIRNAGDVALAAPTFELTSLVASDTEAFSLDGSECSADLEPGSECRLSLSFAPQQAAPHTASLSVVAGEQRAVLLLLGEAAPAGELVLAVAEGQSADFGEVAIGAAQSRSFTITNPASIPTGELSIRTEDSRFIVQLGDCSADPSTSLANGSSCSFSVDFVPNDSSLVVTRLSVQSLDAPQLGEASLGLQGLGRSPAVLVATATRNLGQANLGQEPAAVNQFDWTVENTGDLATGVLALEEDNPEEFEILADGCSGQPLAGQASCQVTIRFRPSAAGNRSGNITVSDPDSGQSVPLQVTGFGVRIAQPGESCVNATCAEGSICTGNVCCDRACDRTCQQCGQDGVCVDQSAQEPCGAAGGNARCFGVDQCQLPAGQSCGSDDDCGGDLLCKQCASGGSQCTAPEACCGGCSGNQTCVDGACGCTAQQIDCGGGLCIPSNQANVCCPSSPDCPASLPGCTSDGRCVECTQASQCTGGPPGTVASCAADNTCSFACGPTQRDCGGGRCISAAANACCGDADCGPCGSCNPNTNLCQNFPFGQQGGCAANQRCNGQGQCFVPQCTGVGQCGDCNTCDNSSLTCVQAPPNATCSGGFCTAGGQCVECNGNDNQCAASERCNGTQCVTRCNDATEVVDAAGNCRGLDGTACQPGGAVCLNNNCVNGRCCPANCQFGCNATGTQCLQCAVDANCPGNNVCRNGQCVPGLGDACTNQCGQGVCFNPPGASTDTGPTRCCEAACESGTACNAQGQCDECFDITAANPLATSECVFAGGGPLPLQYCVPPGQGNNFSARARAACEACEAVTCQAVSCTELYGSGTVNNVTGFTRPVDAGQNPRTLWISSGNTCQANDVAPGQGYTNFAGSWFAF